MQIFTDCLRWTFLLSVLQCTMCFISVICLCVQDQHWWINCVLSIWVHLSGAVLIYVGTETNTGCWGWYSALLVASQSKAKQNKRSFFDEGAGSSLYALQIT